MLLATERKGTRKSHRPSNATHSTSGTKATQKSHVLKVRNGAEAFAPRREIPRTPPRVKPAQARGSRQHNTSITEKSRKFVSTPRRRTPVESKKNVSSRGPVQFSVTPSKSHVDHDENISPGWTSPADRKVQAPCFTPQRMLTRSPQRDLEVPPPPRWEIPRTPVFNPLTTSSPPHEAAQSKTGTSPDQSRPSHIQYGTDQKHHSEKTPCPRLRSPPVPPARSSPLPPARSSPLPPARSSPLPPARSSPVSIKSPPTSSNRSPSVSGSLPPPPPPLPSVDGERGQLNHQESGSSFSSNDGHSDAKLSVDTQFGDDARVAKDPQRELRLMADGTAEEGTSLEATVGRDSERPLPPPESPSISLRRGGDIAVRLPEDLVCNEADLAFLQRMKNMRHHDKLQTEVVCLDKALRAAAEQKEQLQHAAEKVGTDLKEMKEKYQTTVSSICTLHSTFDPAASLNPAHSPSNPTLNDGATLPTELGPAHLSRLRRMQQLMTVQLEKTDSVVQGKVARIHCERQKLKEERRVKERVTAEKTELLREDLQTAKAEKQEWEMKVKETSDEHLRMKQQLESLHAQLSQMKVTARDSTPPGEEGEGEEGEGEEGEGEEGEGEEGRAAERRRAEQRLRRLICRCELYVKRHQLLKQLRKQNSI